MRHPAWHGCLRGQAAVTVGLLLSGVSLRTLCLDLLALCVLQHVDRGLELFRGGSLHIDVLAALQLANLFARGLAICLNGLARGVLPG